VNQLNRKFRSQRFKKIIMQRESLAQSNSQIIGEWHPTKNKDLTPDDLTPYSHKKIWWICQRGHEWQSSISHRTNGCGCPYCSGKLATQENFLATQNPNLAKEWHPIKNEKITPYDVTPKSGRKYWWICPKGHDWEAAISNRNRNRDKGCPYCSGRRICKDYCLSSVNPILASEWHPTKNKNLTSDNVTSRSGIKVWWKCKNEHESNLYICQ
jgi:DNA-directed RNA polymerase subunit RPC12/RpoP